MSLWGLLFGREGREIDARRVERERELRAEKSEIDASGTYTTMYRWPAPMCLRCGAIVGDRHVHDVWHADRP